jgi:hypothetical protein
MKTTARRKSPAIAFNAAGIGLRRLLGDVPFGLFGDLLGFAGGFPLGSEAGTSALIGRVIGAHATRVKVGWLVS